MLIATYDFWGYYNVTFLGGEVRDPEKNIPRALVISIVVVGVLYLVMNVSILGVMPWRELMQSAQSDTRYYVVATMMERLYGHWAGRADRSAHHVDGVRLGLLAAARLLARALRGRTRRQLLQGLRHAPAET